MLKKFQVFFLTAVILLIFTVQAYAEPSIDVATNGKNAAFDPGSTIVISGQLSDGGTSLSNNEVKVTVYYPDKSVYVSGGATTDDNGYYRYFLKAPGTNGTYSITVTAGQASGSTYFKVPAAADTKSLSYSNSGYNTSGSPSSQAGVIPVGTNQFALIFTNNVNYFINGKYESYPVGENEGNTECIELFKGTAATSANAVAVDVDLVDSDKLGNALYSYYNEDNAKTTEKRKRVIVVEPDEDLEPSTTYTVLIKGELSANSGDTLGDDMTVSFTTAADGSVLSNIATITSGTYTVNTANGTITGVSPKTSKDAFLKALTKGEANQSWDNSKISDPVATGDKLVVTAQDGTTKVTYTVTVNTILSNIATLTSGTYTVNAASGAITNVPSGTSKTAFLGHLTKGEPNQTWNESNLSDPVVSGNTLVVTAQDGTTKITYTITVSSAAASGPTGGGFGGGGVSLPDVSSVIAAKDIGQIVTDGGVAKLKVDSQKALDALKANTGTAIGIDISLLTGTSAAQRAVQVPSQVIDAVRKDNKSIVLQNGDLAVVIPPAALVQGEDMTISLGQTGNQNLPAAPGQVANSVTYEFDAQVGGEQTHNFQQAITITLPIPTGVTDPEKLGVYYLNESTGQWEYMGGRIIDGKLVFTTSHFSKYMVAESTKTFTDIASHWAKKDIEVMVARNIINGIEANTFAPDNNITRAEFAALLSRVLKLTDTAGNSTFKDVTSGEWYAGDVEKAAKAGIILGSDGNFRPGDKITRQEMAIMIMRAYKYAGGKVDSLKELTFTDKSSVSSWANDSVKGVYTLGIIKGRTGGSFGALDNATRAEGTVMLRTLMDKLGL